MEDENSKIRAHRRKQSVLRIKDADVYRSFNGCFRIDTNSTSGDVDECVMSVTLGGTGTLAIAFPSTGTSGRPNFGLLDSEGNFIVATSYTVENSGTDTAAGGYTLETENDTSRVYKTDGTSYATVPRGITEAGT